MVNESITDCFPNPGKIPIISQSYQPNQLLARPLLSHPNCPLCSPPLCLSLASFTMLSCHTPPTPPACLNASQTYSAPRLYIRWASPISPITPQPPFTCLSHSSLGSPIPHLTKFCPLPKPQFVFNLWPSNPTSPDVHLLFLPSPRHPSLLIGCVHLCSLRCFIPATIPLFILPYLFSPPFFFLFSFYPLCLLIQ